MSLRDSQRLLSLLNGSFKQQLDREHLNNSFSNEKYASLLLQSILTDPLFDTKPRTRAFSTNKSQCSGMRLGQLQNHMERPMDAFKERASEGTADLGAAKYFLSIQYRACLDSPAATPREAMQSSGAASTILQWLWSSGTEDTGTFLRDRGFVANLVPFLVAEGQHSRILHWLYRCYSPEETPFSSLHGQDTHIFGGHLFVRLIEGEKNFGDGLESAITLFLRTVASLLSSGSSKKSMQFGAIRVAKLLVVRFSKAGEPKLSIFRPFLEMIKKFQLDPQLYADLCLCSQQERPDPQPALKYFHNVTAQERMNPSATRRFHMVRLGLRAAELFLQDGCQTEALWIMDFLQRNFAEELGSPLAQDRKTLFSNNSKKMLRREEESLHLLDTLAVQ